MASASAVDGVMDTAAPGTGPGGVAKQRDLPRQVRDICRIVALAGFTLAGLTIALTLIVATEASFGVSFEGIAWIVLLLSYPGALLLAALCGIVAAAVSLRPFDALIMALILVVTLFLQLAASVLIVAVGGAIDPDSGYHPATAFAPLVGLLLLLGGDAYATLRIAHWLNAGAPS